MWPVLTEVLDSIVSNDDKVTYYNLIVSAHNLKLDNEAEIDFLKAKIQELVSSPMKRNEGLVLMYAAMEQDSTLYIENWGRIIIGSLKCPDSYIPKKLTLKILNKIVTNFSQESIYKDAFQKFIPEILPLLLNLDNEVYEHRCHTLALCMKCVPQILGPHGDVIEKFLLKKLDTSCIKTSEAIAECFAALPICLMHFRKIKTTYMDVWLDVYLRILNTIQSVLNDILLTPGDESGCVNVESLEMFDIPFQDGETYSVLSRIRVFSTFCKCLAKMMSSETCRVQVPIEDLFLSIQRVFQVTNIIKVSDETLKCGLLRLAFPIMLNAVLVVLEAVILNFPIIDQCGNVARVIVKSLEGISAASFSETSTSQSRSTVWKLSNVWLTQYGSKGSSEFVREQFLIQEVLRDIEMDNTDVSQPQYQYSCNGIKSEVTPRDKVLVCAEALKVLRTMIQTGSFFMEKNCMDKISSTVIKVARRLLLHLNPSKQFPLPYSDEKCRKRLFDVLLTCSIAGDPLQTKCVMKSVNIFRIALKDPSIKVSEVCHRAFKYCRFFLNPKKPPPDVIRYSNPNPNMFNTTPPTIEKVKVAWQNPSYWGGRSEEIDMSNEEAQNQEENGYNNPDESVREEEEEEDQDDEDDQEYSNYRAESSEVQDLDDDQNQDEVEELYGSGMDSSQINVLNVESCQGESRVAEMRTEKHVSEEKEANVPTYHNSHESTMRANQNSADSEFEEVEEEEEETPVSNYVRENVNGMEYVEEEDDGHDDEDNEDEEINEECGDGYQSDGKRSADHCDEREAKRQKMLVKVDADETEVNNNSSPSCSSEDGTEIDAQVNNKHSPKNKKNTLNSLSNEENQNDSEVAERSPTVKEMCGDFVLAEPESTEES
ncbi:uncharacterized protein NPIL_509301 [Nephila pilipes]|uniref:Pre-rRNA-processing protein RIX1 N-terminal domain-containing protein n=1 Tax=Nephila pilipes TaxID=299642 RepID=A0A8X6TAQ9_NEPPI|nr:uncharacterized protein NPIL_509301 [Nephila pilipes]